MAHIIADIYVKVNNGDSITNSEMRVAFTHFDQLQLLAYQAGPEFALAAREARRVRDKLESYMEARKIKP